jgi:tetratricopeptide (TPR) repeat protein
MRSIHAVHLIAAAAVLISVSAAARAETDPDSAEFDRATATFSKGDTAGALALVEDILTRSPESQNALYFSALVSFHMGNADAARGRLERVVRLVGNYFAAWEMMVQVTQAQGDLARRDEAIDRLKIAIATAIDPNIRRKSEFIRDRIRVGDQGVSAVDYFERGGSDFTRYQFALGDPRMNPGHGLLLRTDVETTENWTDTALLPPDKQLFHLDLVDARPEGGDKVAIYQYYVGLPDYDTVRVEVLRILRGEVQPLSGQPGSLAGILKP